MYSKNILVASKDPKTDSDPRFWSFSPPPRKVALKQTLYLNYVYKLLQLIVSS
jgi:hypothetical protein